MRLSSDGLALIKRWEGCKLESYQDSAGVWTIGYGRTTATGLGPVGPGMKITQAQAESDLLRGLAKYERTVNECLARTPTQAQYDAMVSLCYNIGQAAFAASSVVKRFNLGKIAEAADAFLMWNKAKVKGKKIEVEGLTNRRHDERKHFLKASVAVAPAPKPAPAPLPPKPEGQPAPPAGPARPPLTIGKVMAWIVAAIFAAVLALLGWGGK